MEIEIGFVEESIIAIENLVSFEALQENKVKADAIKRNMKF